MSWISSFLFLDHISASAWTYFWLGAHKSQYLEVQYMMLGTLGWLHAKKVHYCSLGPLKVEFIMEKNEEQRLFVFLRVIAYLTHAQVSFV